MCGHQVLGLSASAHPDGHTETTVLIDHGQEFESATVRRGVELEIHGPDLVGILSLMAPHRADRWPGPLALPGSKALQALLPPDEAVGHPPAPADVLTSDLAETMP
jgi:hypothetical protein